MKPNILGFGEAMLEYSAEHSNARTSFAGDVINCLKAAQIAGANVSFFSQFGDDAAGTKLKLFLEENGISTRHCKTIRGKTGSYTISTDENGERSFSYDRAGSAASLIKPEDIPVDIFADTDLFYFSGISLAISEGSCRTAMALLQMAKTKNIPIAFDLNFRPRLIPAEKLALLFKEILPSLNHCFLSSDDMPLAIAAFHLKSSTSNKEILRKLADATHAQIIIKMGADGSLLLDEDGQVKVHSAPRVTAVDTSGAGDVFNGVYLASKLLKHSSERAQADANEFASRHVQISGAFPLTSAKT